MELSVIYCQLSTLTWNEKKNERKKLEYNVNVFSAHTEPFVVFIAGFFVDVDRHETGK